MSNKKCPYYQGICGLDEKEEIVCYTDAPECELYQKNEEELQKLRKQFGFIKQSTPNGKDVFVKYE